MAVTDPRTMKLLVKDLGQELHYHGPIGDARHARIAKVNTAKVTLGLGDMRLILNGLAMMARTQTDSHHYRDLFEQLARDHYYPALDATNLIIDETK